METKGGYYFIATVLDMQLALPAAITSTMRLDRATNVQIETIKKMLSRNSFGGMQNSPHYYEGKKIVEPLDNGGSKFYFTELPRQEWRYYVINYSGYNIDITIFFRVSTLVYPYLLSFIHVATTEEFGTGEARAWGYEDGSQIFYDSLFAETKAHVFDESTLTQIVKLYKKFHLLEAVKHEGILRAIDYHSNIKRLRNINHLLVLAYFMIIEMLLTHNPNDKELGDSLSHQIRTKIALLVPRLAKPIDYSIFGNNIKSEKLWTKLYNYRSKIAHGDHVDFESGDLSTLNSQKAADEFLGNATKSLLAHAIEEPDLVNSLKPI